MVDFTHDQCPMCNGDFLPDDDIVVCPICGTPYHRDCYNDTGHCKFESEHLGNYVWKSKYKEETTNIKSCPNCGCNNDSNALFCDKCGFSFSKENYIKDEENLMSSFEKMFDPFAGIDPDEKIYDITIREFADYIKLNSNYYICEFKKIQNNKSSRFNIGAFLFTGFWMLYRKQYTLGTIVFVVMSFIDIISRLCLLNINASDELYGNIFSNLSSSQRLILIAVVFIEFAIRIFLGFKANRIYMKHCISKIKSIKSNPDITQDISQKIKNSGGVSFIMVSILMMITVIYRYVILYFIM